MTLKLTQEIPCSVKLSKTKFVIDLMIFEKSMKISSLKIIANYTYAYY